MLLHIGGIACVVDMLVAQHLQVVLHQVTGDAQCHCGQYVIKLAHMGELGYYLKRLNFSQLTESVIHFMGEISVTSRAKILSQFLAEKTSSAEKHVYAMCGIPGSGKSTYVARALKAGAFPENAFLLNPDEVMQALPEYHEDYQTIGAEAAFEKWQMPTRALAYDLLENAAERGLNIIIDMGCVREEDFNNILQLKKRGYQVHMHHVFCPPEIAIQRIGVRERFTPEEMIWERAEALKGMLAKYRMLAHQFLCFDNSDEEEPFRILEEQSLAKAL